MNPTRFLMAMGLAGFLGACAPEADDLRGALPSRQAVTIQAPEGNENALTLGERSQYYLFTREVTVGVNSTIGALFNLLEDIAEMPPTTSEEGRVVWGPGSDALDPVIYRMVVEAQGEEHFTYALQFRPKGSADEEQNYKPLISGAADKSSGVNDGLGEMIVHADFWGEAEGRDCSKGKLIARYDTTGEPQKLTVDFAGFQTCDDGEELDGATYYYDRNADGGGNFQFSAHGDIHEGERLPAVKELLEVRSRWMADGRGRSDVRISGGDIEVGAPGITEVQASECWDASFGLVFGSVTPDIVDLEHIGGELSSCAFAEASFPTAL